MSIGSTNGNFIAEYHSEGYAAVVSIDPDQYRYCEIPNITGDITVNIPAGTSGGEIFIKFNCNASPHTITWGTNITAYPTTLALTASKVTVVMLVNIAGSYHLLLDKTI